MVEQSENTHEFVHLFIFQFLQFWFVQSDALYYVIAAYNVRVVSKVIKHSPRKEDDKLVLCTTAKVGNERTRMRMIY